MNLGISRGKVCAEETKAQADLFDDAADCIVFMYKYEYKLSYIEKSPIVFVLN